eukprot:2748082-Prymnesium_polylepis.1
MLCARHTVICVRANRKPPRHISARRTDAVRARCTSYLAHGNANAHFLHPPPRHGTHDGSIARPDLTKSSSPSSTSSQDRRCP